MDLYIKFLLRFDSKNKVLEPYHALFNLSRDSYTPKNNLITLFTKHYHESYIELRLLLNSIWQKMNSKIISKGIWSILFVLLLTACETDRRLMYGNHETGLENLGPILFGLAIGFLLGFLFAKTRRHRRSR